MNVYKINRRRFLLGAIFATPLLAAADAKWVEPKWVKTRRLRLSPGKPSHRFVHITDVHHKGDRQYLLSVVRKINALSPEFVCFTGDLIEEKKYLPEALELLGGIKSPLYGVPGNHDYCCQAAFEDFEKAFTATGGGWLMDRQLPVADGAFQSLA